MKAKVLNMLGKMAIWSFVKGGQRLVVHYSSKRAHRDSENRRKGLERLKQR